MREDNEKVEIKETRPFNDVTEHYQTIMGVPNKSIDLNSMPKGVKWFGYFFMGMAALCALSLIVSLVIYYN